MLELSPLVKLYGDGVIESAMEEIEKLKVNSNIPFDASYVRLGISFMQIKAEQILKKEKAHCKLTDLTSESFGEAAIYKYNVMGE